MAGNTYNNHVQTAKLITDALKARETNLPAIISRDGLTKFVEQLNNVHKLNQEQEKLKAELKSKTAALDDALQVLKKQTAETKKLIKIAYPQHQWVEFGIEDKR